MRANVKLEVWVLAQSQMRRSQQVDARRQDSGVLSGQKKREKEDKGKRKKDDGRGKKANRLLNQ